MRRSLILADALALAAKQKPMYMINLGRSPACMVALGPQVGGFSKQQSPLADALLRSPEKTRRKLCNALGQRVQRDD